MPFAFILASTAQGHPLIKGTAISHHRCLSDDDAAAVVDEDSGADFCTGVDFHPGDPPGKLRDETGQKKPPVTVEKIGGPVQHDGVQSGIEKQHFGCIAGGRVPLPYRTDICS